MNAIASPEKAREVLMELERCIRGEGEDDA